MQLFFVTFVTHNSRISDRMVTYNTNEFIKNLSPFVLKGEDYLKMIALIAEGIHRYQIKTVAFTVIPDHVHLLIKVEDEKTLNEQIRKLKGFTSFQFQRYRNWDKGENHIWAQKFHRKEIQLIDTDINKVVNYILNNTQKHHERWGTILKEGQELLNELNEKNCIQLN